MEKQPIVKACLKKCNECAFKRGGIQNTLTPEFIDYIKNNTLFPCHEKLKKFSGSENQGTELYIKQSKTVYTCRGHIECLIKSGMITDNGKTP